jgi:hypothetical protein
MADDGILQTKCWIAAGGHLWMEGYFDTLPVAVRRRLRNSPYNLCPACLVTEFLPQVKAKQHGLSREQALFVAVQIMESEVRRGDAGRGRRRGRRLRARI